MRAAEEFEQELVDELPSLFRFAMSMTRNRNEAEELVQETLAYALEKRDEFTSGTNIRAWLFKLQSFLDRNSKRKAYRQKVLSRGQIEDPETAAVPPSQLDRIMVGEAEKAIETLPLEQRQALFLVAYDGKSYDEAADILECSAGTVKSRVSRARQRIADMIHYEHLNGMTKELGR
jgi:RNA polymerase sigma factor, sigma-70 family